MCSVFVFNIITMEETNGSSVSELGIPPFVEVGKHWSYRSRQDSVWGKQPIDKLQHIISILYYSNMFYNIQLCIQQDNM